MSREKQRTAAIRQKLENLKAEMAAQDRELADALVGAELDRFEMADAERKVAALTRRHAEPKARVWMGAAAIRA